MTLYHPALRRTLLAIALGLAFLPVHRMTLAAEPIAAESCKQYRIEAGELSHVLTQFGRQAGILISFSSELTAGQRSAGLNGEYTQREALQSLLDNSNLEALNNEPGAYVLRQKPSKVADTSSTSRPAFGLPTVYVTEQHTLEAGVQTLSAQAIKETPSANRSLSELAAINPAVRLGNGAGSSQTRGSMDVENISFHGASPYQNLFQIDGMNASNNINPAESNTNLQIGAIASNSQAYFVDTSLLGEVKIYDSNIPVEFGRFNGGVIDATLKRASGNHFGFSYRKSGSNLSEQKIAVSDASNYEYGKSGTTPDWRKNFYSMTMERMLSDDLGVVLGISRRESTIRRASYVASNVVLDGIEEHHDLVDNVMAKFTWWKSAGTISDLTLKYSQREAERNNSAYRATRWANNHDAKGVAWNLDHKMDGANLNVKIGWDRFDDSRVSDSNSFITYFWEAVPGTPSYTISTGGYGKEEKSKDALTLSSKLSLDPFHTGVLEHTAFIGVNAEWSDIRFQRYQNSYSYQLRYLAAGGQQERNKVQYLPGTVNMSYQNLGLYTADQIRWDRFTLTPGVRIDRDNYLENNNVSPRVRADWDVLGNQRTILTAGAARYYGSDILDFALRERISLMQRTLTNSTGGAVVTPTVPTLSNYRDLKTPYNDELSLSWTQAYSGMRSVLSYVVRDGRDQISRKLVSTNNYQYVNAGITDSNTLGLSLVNEKPWKFASGTWHTMLTLGHSKFNSNGNLVTGYDENLTEDKVYYNGNLINAIDKPASTFNQPKRVTLQLNGSWEQTGLNWNNQFNWKSKRKDIFNVGKIAGINSYVDGELPSYWTWDASFSYRPDFLRGVEFSMDILNVLNRMPAVIPTSPLLAATDRNQYANGREIWLQASYKF